MKIAYNLPTKQEKTPPVVLTVGNFDGVHLGHQKVLNHLKSEAEKSHTKTAVITFSNHPSTVLRPNQELHLLCTPSHKAWLFQQAHIDFLYMLKFTKEFSEQSAEIFLQRIQQTIPFQKLIFGSDGTIGKNREGDRHAISIIAKKLGFSVEYLTDYAINESRISSSRIRALIRQGDLALAEKLLGRTFSIYAPVIKGAGRGASIGFHTANIDVEGLCLPPLGVYAVSLWHKGVKHLGVANLGIAPTVRENRAPLLEVHLFDLNINLYEELVDVHFHGFIRTERRFDSLSQLSTQIAHDIMAAKQQLSFSQL